MFTFIKPMILASVGVLALASCTESDTVTQAKSIAPAVAATEETAPAPAEVAPVDNSDAKQVIAAQPTVVNASVDVAEVTETAADGLAGDRTSLIQTLQLQQAPDGATSVAQLRKAGFKPGQKVAIRGQIGGRNPPWVQGVGLLMVADAVELQACTTGTCGAPWDFCSAPLDKLIAHTGVIRWADENGEPREIGFEEVAEIAPLSTIVVSGTIADVGDEQALVIDADGFYLEDPGPFAEMMKAQRM